MSFQKELVQQALEMGAEKAAVFQLSDIAFDKRTLLKCLYGCGGGVHYCPVCRDAATAAAMTEMAKAYRWGVIMMTSDLKTGQDITLALESKAFLAGFTWAFGATECVGCESCTVDIPKPCNNKDAQRPPLYAFGIDIYKTVRGLGWTLDVVQKKGDPAKNITAVFVE